MPYLKYVLLLIRWPNLVIVFFAQYLFAHCLIAPFQLFFTKEVFYAVAIACVLAAASGNIINDYYDRDIDKINKPGKVFIGQYIPPNMALFFYFLFNIAAVTLAVYADSIQYSCYVTVFVVGSIALLWLYSCFFKKTFLAGNLVVAFLTTAPMLLLCMLSIKDRRTTEGLSYLILSYLIPLLFMFFSFWTSLIREIIKDCEDVEGDRVAKSRTLPICLGIKKAKMVVGVLTLILIVILTLLVVVLMAKGLLLLSATSITLLAMSFSLYRKIRTAETATDFHRASRRCKLLMLAGILSMLFIGLGY